MADEEEPPSLGKVSTPPRAAPPASAFPSSGAAPPAAAFSHGGTPSSSNNNNSKSNLVTPPADDLNNRWKQYEKEMEFRRSESSLSRNGADAADDERMTETLGTPAGGGTAATSAGYKNYQLNDSLSPRSGYSFTKSSSYDTNELIRKYSGVAGIPPTVSSSGNLPPASSFRRSSSTASSSSAAVREEALQVLGLVDEHLNAAPFHVRRTESGGFRASSSSLSSNNDAPYRVRRTNSGAVVVEQEEDGGEDGQDGNGSAGNRPYFVKRTASGTITSGRGQRRTPAALSGLGLSDAAANNSRTSWKAGRYSFSDPKFREDDYLAEEEDDIIGPAGTFDENDPSVEVVPMSPFKDKPSAEGDFDGDFPRGSSTWSSRYTDNPHKTKRMLDQWDRGHYGSRDRQSARNMFISTASNVREAATHVGDAMASKSARVFGAGYSFRQSHTFGNQKENTNLNAIWKDDQDSSDSIQGTRVHTTWQEAMLNKKRRRRICGSLLCAILAIVVLSVSIAATSEQRAEKRASKYPGSGMGVPVTFYATSNTPYDGDEEKQLASNLATIPNDAEFIIHLGNLQDASVTMCPESRYSDAASVLKKSPVPLFVVPGEQDWVKCPRQKDSFNKWLAAFGTFEAESNNGMEVERSHSNPEIFSSLYNGVLFFGLHQVSGSIQDTDAHEARQQDMRNFFLGMLNYHKGQFRAVVIMGNARPGPQQQGFFNSIADALRRYKGPVAYVHADSGVGDAVYTPLPELPHLLGVQVPTGNTHKPLKITVGYGSRPFVVG